MPRIVLLALFLLPTAAQAQYPLAPSDVFGSPLRPDRAPLAATAEVPEVFRLFVGGDAPVLVNPARAAGHDARFVYGTLHGTPASEPCCDPPPYPCPACYDDPAGFAIPGARPLTFVGLFGTRDLKWLVSADHAVRYRDEEAENAFSDVMPIPGGSVTLTSTVDDGTRDEAMQTRARVALVRRTGFGGYALGLFGGYRRQAVVQDGTATSTQVAERESPGTSSTDRFESTSERVFRDERDLFAAGAEVAFAGRTWDLAATATYQGATADFVARNEFAQVERMVQSDGSFERLVEVTDRTAVTRSAAPYAVDVEVLGALRAGLSRGDYLYGSVAVTAGTGTDELDTERFFRRFERVTTDGNTTAFSDLDGASASAQEDVEGHLVHAALGYVYALERRRLRVLAGLNPAATFGSVEGLGTGFDPYGTPAASDQTVTALALALPLHAEADVTRSLRLFGGGAFAYRWVREETRLVPLDVAGPGPLGPAQELDRSAETFASDSRLYGGARFATRGGFTAQAAFRGDLARFEGWTVSLGYRF